MAFFYEKTEMFALFLVSVGGRRQHFVKHMQI